MGNTLVKNISSDARFNDSLLGQEVAKIFREEIAIDRDGQFPINQRRACCLDVGSGKKSNDFVSISLPLPLKESECKIGGKCIEPMQLGLQFQLSEKDCGEYITTREPGKENRRNKCDNFMVDHCAKSLYDAGCIKVIKNSQGRQVRVWDGKNPKCFTKRGQLVYGPPECACINSQTGFTLNTDPSAVILDKDGKNRNPYGLKTPDEDNLLTVYSLNVFGYDNQYQKPQVLDTRCSSLGSGGSVVSGRSVAYKLPEYKNNQLSLCINQINIKDSDIGSANFDNIKQSNDCGSQPKPKGSKSIEGIKVDATKKSDEDKKAKEDASVKKKAEDASIKKKAESKATKDKEVAEKVARVEEQKDTSKTEKGKAQLEALKKQAEDRAKARKEAERLAAEKVVADKAAAKVAADKAAADKVAADKVAEEKAKKEAESKRRTTIIIAIAGLIVVLGGIVVFMGRSKSSSDEDEEDEDEDED